MLAEDQRFGYLLAAHIANTAHTPRDLNPAVDTGSLAGYFYVVISRKSRDRLFRRGKHTGSEILFRAC